MKKMIKNFQQIGICELDINKVLKYWTDKFSISQYNDEYTLIRWYRGENNAKAKISKEQAEEVIAKLRLVQVKDTFFRHASCYRTRSHVELEIQRVEKIRNEKRNEMRFLEEALTSFKDALYNHKQFV